MAFQIGAGVGEEREAGSVRFWKAIQCERRDRLDDFLLRLAKDAVAIHAGAQLQLNFFHSFLGALETEGAAQILRFATAESGCDHGYAQELLLKQRHAERSLKNRLKRRMQTDNWFAPLTALQIRIHHFSDDRARADDGDLHDDVVKLCGHQTRQAGHLRAAFDLEHSDRVGFLQRPIHSRIVGRQFSEVDVFAVISR